MTRYAGVFASRQAFLANPYLVVAFEPRVPPHEREPLHPLEPTRHASARGQCDLVLARLDNAEALRTTCATRALALCDNFGQRCCTPRGELAACGCQENACDASWFLADCVSGIGAGVCGWNEGATAYTCGGNGGDPGGAVQACADAVGQNQDCEGLVGTTCCSADGDARACLEGPNGIGPNWVPTDCVLE